MLSLKYIPPKEKCFLAKAMIGAVYKSKRKLSNHFKKFYIIARTENQEVYSQNISFFLKPNFGNVP